LNYAKGRDHSTLVQKLLKDDTERKSALSEKIGLVIFEDIWWDLDKNPRQASSLPFLDGLARYMDKLTAYRFNFYDTASFEEALTRALKVKEKRVILYIGAHGSYSTIGGARLKTLLDKLREKSKNDKKIEGVILSSCLAGGNEEAMSKAFGGGTHWLFGYNASVDWLGSVLIETTIIENLCRNEQDYCDSSQKMVDLFKDALGRFNPNWKIAADVKNNEVPLKSAISFWVRPKGAKLPRNLSGELTDAAWKP